MSKLFTAGVDEVGRGCLAGPVVSAAVILKGGIKLNPKDYSEKDLELITRGYKRAINNYIGHDYDIPAPDVGTNSQIMDWIMDEYNLINNDHIKSVITGKSPECGGSLGRKEATGRGIGVLVNEITNDFSKENHTIKL